MSNIKVWIVGYGKGKNLKLQWLDPVTGRRKTRSAKTKSRTKARDAAAALQKELNEREPTGDGSIPFDEFLTLYHAEHLASLDRDSSYRAFGILEILQRNKQPKTLRSVTAQTLSEHFAWLRQNGRRETTIALHRRTIRAALQWAVDHGHLPYVPKMPKVRRAGSAGETRAKGRPLTTNEFVKMLKATKSIVGPVSAKSWRRLLRGLWLSGLRLGEALALGWTPDHELWIETRAGEFPLLGIKPAGEKAGKSRLLPLTPDFAKWILRTPTQDRVGRVFKLDKMRYRDKILENHVSKQVSLIGKAAGLIVSETGKHASAHDLRRSFGLRWALQVMPAELQQLMRHADIHTTMKYYVSIEAQDFAARLWAKDANTTKYTTKTNQR